MRDSWLVASSGARPLSLALSPFALAISTLANLLRQLSEALFIQSESTVDQIQPCGLSGFPLGGASESWGSSLVCRSSAVHPCSAVATSGYLVDPASSHMLVSKIKPCMSKYKRLYCETANGSLNQLWFI
jgi:hypothetical protein